ncbi:MAG: hypothetical protein KAS78_00450, partial [Candidatus Pacebacteria bacterium]|nr:hypothetical protein [Candidatus Paceibacterota bacterium]
YRQKAPSMAQGGTISDNSAYTALTVTQSGSGDIVNILDGTTSVFNIADGGTITISSSFLPSAGTVDLNDASSMNPSGGAGTCSTATVDTTHTYFYKDQTGTVEIGDVLENLTESLQKTITSSITCVDASGNTLTEVQHDIVTGNSGGEIVLGGLTPADTTAETGDGVRDADWTTLYTFDNADAGVWDGSADIIFVNDGNIYYDDTLDTKLAGAATENSLGSTSDEATDWAQLSYIDAVDANAWNAAADTIFNDVDSSNTYTAAGDGAVIAGVTPGDGTAETGDGVRDSDWTTLYTFDNADAGAWDVANDIIFIDDALIYYDDALDTHLAGAATENALGSTSGEATDWAQLSYIDAVDTGAWNAAADTIFDDTNTSNTFNKGDTYDIISPASVDLGSQTNPFRDVYARKFFGTQKDIAEIYKIRSIEDGRSPEAGDVVVPDPDNPGGMILSTEPYQSTTSGIISTDPSFLLGGMEDSSQKAVALAGQVPVKVSLENGEISVGDFLTSSSTPGIAMKAIGAGRVIGMALEPFDGSEIMNDELGIMNNELRIGKVIAFINLSFSLGSLNDDGSLDVDSENNNDTNSEENEEQPTVLSQFTLAIKNSLGKLGLIVENGIARVKELVTDKVTTKEICIEENGEEVCIDKNKLKELLEKMQIPVSSSTSDVAPITPIPDAPIWGHLTEENCSLNCGHWYSETCNAEEEVIPVSPSQGVDTSDPVCDANNLDLCNTKDLCDGIDLHWHGDVCNLDAKPVSKLEPEPILEPGTE